MKYNTHAMSASDQNSDELNNHLRQLRSLIYGNGGYESVLEKMKEKEKK